MKVICTQENLKSGLFIVSRIISQSSTLPILNNILLKTENGQLQISATNLEVAVSTVIRCKVEEDGEICVFARTVSDLVNNLPNKNITLESSNGTLKIETENYHTTIKTLPADEFPLIPKIEEKGSIIVGSGELKKALDQVIFAASTNQTQPEISGVVLKVSDTALKIAATDRYRLAERKLSFSKNTLGTKEVIVPHKTVAELSRIIGNQETEVTIVMSETQISIHLDQTEIVSRLIDGSYPPYEEIIPDSFSTTITTPRQGLVNALKTSGIFSQNNNSVKLEYSSDDQKLSILSGSQELGESDVNLPSQVDGSSGFVILNHRYILDCLNGIDEDAVLIKITNETTATVITPEKSDNYIYLVMPIKS
jgi:DNA polymerase-3 subunit beta